MRYAIRTGSVRLGQMNSAKVVIGKIWRHVAKLCVIQTALIMLKVYAGRAIGISTKIHVQRIVTQGNHMPEEGYAEHAMHLLQKHWPHAENIG